jgi:hypothetical protein
LKVRCPSSGRDRQPDRRRELGTLRVAADPAVDHGAGGLAGAAQLDQLQARVAEADRGVELVGIALVGLDADTRRVRLDSLRERVA